MFFHIDESGNTGMKRFSFGFDYYYIDKPVHALVVLSALRSW